MQPTLTVWPAVGPGVVRQETGCRGGKTRAEGWQRSEEVAEEVLDMGTVPGKCRAGGINRSWRFIRIFRERVSVL